MRLFEDSGKPSKTGARIEIQVLKIGGESESGSSVEKGPPKVLSAPEASSSAPKPSVRENSKKLLSASSSAPKASKSAARSRSRSRSPRVAASMPRDKSCGFGFGALMGQPEEPTEDESVAFLKSNAKKNGDSDIPKGAYQQMTRQGDAWV